MWLEEIWELGKSPLVLLFCIFLPLGVTAATQQLEATVSEFRVHRLQQFDYHGNLYGSRGWRMSFEAAALGQQNTLRRCLVLWWRDLVGVDLHQILQSSLGAALVVIPPEDRKLSDEDAQALMNLEQALVVESFAMPIYLAPETPNLKEILHSLLGSIKSQDASAFSVLAESVMANSFQLVSGNQASSAKIDAPLYNIVGTLSAYERGSNVPTIAIVAHYDAFGAAPALSFGADSNGSGVAALLELARLFHRLYQSGKTRAKYNLIFLLSGGGKLNFQGTRQWIEEYLEQNEGNSQLEFALCIDSIGKGKVLNVHVSKAPTEKSPIHKFFNSLESAAAERFGERRKVALVQKKINLAEEFLGWEHERFNIRKVRAFTVSHYESHKDPRRRSILDTRNTVDVRVLQENVELLAEALQRQIYRSPSGAESREALFGKKFSEEAMLKSWMDRLASIPRSLQLMTDGAKNPIIAELFSFLDQHSHQATLLPVQADKKDPDFVLYGATVDTISVHKVKPAVFDLLLAGFIGAYLALLYYLVLNAHGFLDNVRQLFASSLKMKI